MKIYNISAKISKEEKERIICFIQGAVYSFCKNNYDDGKFKAFAARDFFGGVNNDWAEHLFKFYMIGMPTIMLIIQKT